MTAKAYGVGVGPGDPELMTLKAIRLIKENSVIALPGKEPEETIAYKIAVQAVPELKEKELLALDMPMVRDREEIERYHRAAAKAIEANLDKGENVIFLTLGDSTFYCTFNYLQRFLEEDGYETELVPGITSFCAAAARLNLPLAEWDEPLHILPASHKLDDKMELSGNYVLMKSGSHMKEVKEMLTASGREVWTVENCGMPNEKVCRGADEIPDDAGYFSLVIAK
ncbi:MAG: precorrin-2 C(20)-methyltransferase [Firmicutes bacterium]|nr:precorrin-2 C(20)-methyltransferase [Bacillota bacterium]